MRTKRKLRISPWAIILIIFIAVLSIFLFKACSAAKPPEELPVFGPPPAMGPRYKPGPLTIEDKIDIFSRFNDVTIDDYPKSMIELYERNPETEEFVLNYPLLKDSESEIDLSEYENCSSVPLIMQWDTRWGYKMYGDDIFGLTGCGPTCLSMVAIYLLQDTTYDPAYIANYSIENGHCVEGNGTAWTLMSEGGEDLGMDVTEIPLVEQRIIDNLEVGNPIICVVGPGNFTTTGHFIIMTGYEDGLIRINDPNSKANSEKLWAYDDIYDEIRNLWVFRTE